MKKLDYRHLILSGAALILTASPAMARQLSEDEARTVAMSFIDKNSPKFKKVSGKNHELKVAYIAERKAENAFYVFNHGDNAGFMIVSADDRLPQILGYSSEGNFDYAQMPENLKWWLGQYEEEIFSFYSQPEAITPQATAAQNEADSKSAIPALISTQWDQGAPYNNDCPTDEGRRCVTGCAATALAQIINYHKYPTTNGTGTYSYSWNGETLSYDYATANFDWANMLNTYNSSSPTVSKNAVANLMLACGVGLHMNYSSGESGASDIAVPRFLVENMGYDGSVTIVQRTHYSLKEWQDLIYKELSQSRPVFYTGQANSGGHAFVCDGYSGNGYFHINWGWSGMSDGDYLLSALNPGDQGIGSYEGGYNSGQSAVINIMENQGSARSAILFMSDGFTCNNNRFKAAISSFSTYTVNATLGLEIVSESNADKVTYAIGREISVPGANLDAGQYSTVSLEYVANPTGLSAGKYRCYPAYKTSDTHWERLRAPYGEQQYIELTIGDDDSISFTNPGSEIPYDLTVTSFSVSGKIYRDSQATCMISVRNNAEADYNKTIRMEVSRGEAIVMNQSFNISVAAKQSFNGGFYTTFDLEPGNYDVNFFDAANKSINAKPFIITVEEGNAPVEPTGLIVKGISPDIYYYGYSSTLTITMFNNSQTEAQVGTFTLKTSDGQGKTISTFRIDGQTLSAGHTLNYGIGGFHIPADAGKYFLEVLADGKSMGEPIAIYNAGEANGIWYTLTEDAAHARLVQAPVQTTVANNIFDVPSKVTLAGNEYEVTTFETNAFNNYSGISTVFVRPETAPSGIGAAVAVLPAETAYYVENYDNYVDQLGENIYAILKSIELSEPTSNALDLNVNDEFQFDVIYTPSEHVNHEVTISSTPVDMFEFNPGTFANGRKTINGKFLKTGTGSITVTSAQPGSVISDSFEINGTQTGIEQIAEDSKLNVTRHGNTLIVSGIARGYQVNVFNAAGQTVASRVSDGQTIYIDMPGAGLYIVSADNKSLKVAF